MLLCRGVYGPPTLAATTDSAATADSTAPAASAGTAVASASEASAADAATAVDATTSVDAASDATASSTASWAGRRPLRVGSLTLEPCRHVGDHAGEHAGRRAGGGRAVAYCGRLDRALDPAGELGDRISIVFEYYPHSAPGRSLGTLVATEGGPGYPATESREDYLDLFKPLMRHRDVLIMDNRGTGRSGAVDCRELQSGERWTIESVAACGRSLGPRAPLYSTAYAADDLAAILEALAVARIDLYGDSYGTYFEQVFAVRHPGALRSIVLDGAYPLDGPDYAWYPTYAPAMRDKFNIACRRSAACARLPGSSIERLLPVLESLRRASFAAHAPDADGKELGFTADASHLATTLFGSAPAFATVREVDAAARAFLADDRLSLLRLMAESITGVDSRDPTGDSRKWSAGLAAAVMCQDSPQIFDMRLEPAQRVQHRDRVIAERVRSHPDTYGPFTIDEYRGMPLDYSFIDQCVLWPVAPAAHPPSSLGVDARYPDVPALVISGELDNMTTPADGAAVARAFKEGRQILINNSFHVNALPRARSACGAQIVRRFLDTRDPGDVGCALRVPPVRLVPRFATQALQLQPAAALPGNSAGRRQRQWVTAAVFTAGDVLARTGTNSTGHGVGLRGGTFTITTDKTHTRLALRSVRWTEDIAVSGEIVQPLGRDGEIRANLRLAAPQGGTGRLTIRWNEGGVRPMARIAGRCGGAVVAALSPAP